MEFDVFKYAKDASGKGLVALQYAQHIKTKDMDVADFRKVRERTVEEMADTDIAPARDYFAEEGARSKCPGRRSERQDGRLVEREVGADANDVTFGHEVRPESERLLRTVNDRTAR